MNEDGLDDVSDEIKYQFDTTLRGDLSDTRKGGDLSPEHARALDAFEGGDYATALAMFSRLARDGDAEASFLLFRMYSEGLGIETDLDAACGHLRDAADRGSPGGLNTLGVWLFEGIGSSLAADPERGFRLMLDSARKGDVRAQYNAAYILQEGMHVEPDFEQAVFWYRRSAEGGHPLAQIVLALHLALGRAGGPRDYVGARRLLYRAAAQGLREAQFWLAEFLRSGWGGPVDDRESFHWLQQSAEQGYVEAVHTLGISYEKGLGVPPAPATARKYYEQAAATGFGKSMTALGFLYEKGDGVPKDPTKAMEWYSKAARAEEPLGQLRYGDGMIYGLGAPVDAEGGARWVVLAAEQGSTDAQTTLATLYAHGLGVPQDDGKAAQLFLLAAEEGHAGAMLSLAKLHFMGRGVEKSEARTGMWTALAADAGDEEAEEMVDTVLAMLEPDDRERALEMANEWKDQHRLGAVAFH